MHIAVQTLIWTASAEGLLALLLTVTPRLGPAKLRLATAGHNERCYQSEPHCKKKVQP